MRLANPDPPSEPKPMSRSTTLVLALLAGLLLPLPAQAQLGAIEAFARRVSDLSFYFTVGGVAGSQTALENEPAGITAFGVELLFEVAETRRPIEGAVAAQPPDSVTRTWTGMEVVHSPDGVDTVYTYEVEPVPPPPLPTEPIWVMELGLGYGQHQGYRLADPELAMNVSLRDLPSVTLYANYGPWGNYFGLRTGFMRTQALQVTEAGGATFTGEADAFLFGGLVGYATAFESLWLLLETGYTIRNFPSVAWTGPGELPTALPRELDMSGWFVSTGIQFPFR